MRTKRRLRLYGSADAANYDVLSRVGVRSFSRAWGEYQVAGALAFGSATEDEADQVE